MKKPWYENSNVISVIVALSVLLLLFVPFKLDLITFSAIERKKDLIDSLSKIITVIFLISGGIFSYLRFFHRRILKPKIDLQFNTTFHALNEINIHSIEIIIKNKGSVAVWNYDIEIYSIYHPGSQISTDISSFVLSSNIDEIAHLVEVGETAFEHAIIEISKIPAALTFQVILTDDQGNQWRRCMTISNVQNFGQDISYQNLSGGE